MIIVVEDIKKRILKFLPAVRTLFGRFSVPATRTNFLGLVESMITAPSTIDMGLLP